MYGVTPLSPGQTIATSQRNTSQHLLVQHLLAPAKRSLHLKATDRNIGGRNMLHAFGHRVAACCDMLRVENRPGERATLLQGQTTTTSCSIHKCCMKNLIIFKFEPTTPNMSQHVTTGWPNSRNMLHPAMLRYVASSRLI